MGLHAAATATSFSEAIEVASNHDGDSDSTASIAGQLYGAKQGFAALPAEAVYRLDVLEALLELFAEWERANESILVELRTLGDWQSRLGDPELHWKRGASAMELAIAWMGARRSARGLPKDVAAILDAVPALRGCAIKLAVPELRTALPGGSRASQTDLWALLNSTERWVSLSVEGKATESFGDITQDWLDVPRPDGRNERLTFLREQLGFDEGDVLRLRYQLLHRTVAALLEAEEWRADAAVMLVQHFGPAGAPAAESWQDFVNFAAQLGVTAETGRLQEVPRRLAAPLWIGWLESPVASDAQIAAVVG